MIETTKLTQKSFVKEQWAFDRFLKKIDVIFFLLLFSLLFVACEERGTGWKPGELPDDPVVEPEQPVNPDDIHKFRAPLYWSVYEYAWVAEQAGGGIDMSETEWDRVIDWAAENLLPYGYDMLCTDGFMSMLATDESGYMTQYGSMDLYKLVEKCKKKGLRLGIYDNPLWIHGPENTIVPGTTNITFGDLRYKQGEGGVLYPNANDSFSWVVPSHKGAKEYIDGFFKHFKDMGVEYIRMDFLCLFEDATGAGGMPGKGYGRENYKLALQYICESAYRHGVFTSLVMPNLYNNAELEKKYGNMVRIVADTFEGGWWHISDRLRGTVGGGWPNCHNQFDGFTYWSQHIGGREKVILDGDFLRLNTLANDYEKETAVSLQLIAGSPVSIADQYNTVGNNLKFYQNREMLALNADGFVGKPMSHDLWNPNSQIWYGQMSNGDWIVGLFNRENDVQTRSINFSDLGISGTMAVRDLWKHEDLGEKDRLEVTLQPHACMIVKLTKSDIPADLPYKEVYITGGATPYEWNTPFVAFAYDKTASKGTFVWEGELKEGELKFPLHIRIFEEEHLGPKNVGNDNLASLSETSVERVNYRGREGDLDKKWKVTTSEAGRYKISLNVIEMKVKFEKQ
jgi:hypothetical protein